MKTLLYSTAILAYLSGFLLFLYIVKDPVGFHLFFSFFQTFSSLPAPNAQQERGEIFLLHSCHQNKCASFLPTLSSGDDHNILDFPSLFLVGKIIDPLQIL